MKHQTYHVFFNNLANPLRVNIISALNEKDLCVKELSKKLDIEQSKLSHALTGLRNCNIVNVRRKGKKRVYGLNKETIRPMLKLIEKHAKLNCKGKCESCICYN